MGADVCRLRGRDFDPIAAGARKLRSARWIDTGVLSDNPKIDSRHWRRLPAECLACDLKNNELRCRREY
jgi:hypothetical protein